MDDLASDLRDLKADFQRLADRASWVRACFNWKDGKFGLFGLGHAGGDGVSEATLISSGLHDLALITELYSLTHQAGTHFVRLTKSKRYVWEPVSPKVVPSNRWTPTDVWLLFLTHTPPVLFNCFARKPDGSSFLACPLLVEANEVLIWIDNYPQVCVGALSLLKSGVSTPGGPQLAKTESLNTSIVGSRRLVFDDGSRTIALDGVTDSTPLEPAGYQILKVLGEGGRCGTWVSGPDINTPGLTGKKLSRILAKLPTRWRKLIKSQKGSGGGYCLTLPPLKKVVP